MQIRNDYNLPWAKEDGTAGEGVFNGDMGVITAIDKPGGAIHVRIDDKDVVYDFERASNELEPAYAVTVHKSQGNEFPAVVIPVLDPPRQLCYRNLLYTGVTRAKQLLILVGRRGVIDAMVENNRKTRRYTGLKHFLEREEILALNGRRDLSPKAFYGEWKLLHHRHMEELPDFRLEKELYALDLEELYQKYKFTRDPRRDVEVMLAIQGTRAAFPEVRQVLEELASRFLLAVGSTTDTAPFDTATEDSNY